jgi:hypothetical protein
MFVRSCTCVRPAPPLTRCMRAPRHASLLRLCLCSRTRLCSRTCPLRQRRLLPLCLWLCVCVSGLVALCYGSVSLSGTRCASVSVSRLVSISGSVSLSPALATTDAVADATVEYYALLLAVVLLLLGLLVSARCSRVLLGDATPLVLVSARCSRVLTTTDATTDTTTDTTTHAT